MNNKTKQEKLLFIITKGNFGGAQKYIFDLATQIKDKGYECVVACGTKEGSILKDKLENSNIKTIDIDGSEREIHILNELRTFYSIIKIIKKEKPDIVHLNSSKIGILGSLAGAVLKISGYKLRLVFTAHNWAFNEALRSTFWKTIFYFSHLITILLCDKTIAVSQKIKDDIDWLFTSKYLQKKVVVIHNGLNKFDMIPKEKAKNKLEIQSSKKIILSISELHPNKGLDVALNSIAILPEKYKKEILYIIIGEGEERKKLEKLIDELKITDYVKLKGFIQNAKQYLEIADIFLLPSRNEAFPYVILEAGSASLAIIATKVGGVPEIINDMENGILVHKNNPKEISEAIIYIIENESESINFGKKINHVVKNKFTLDKMVKRTIDLYGI